MTRGKIMGALYGAAYGDSLGAVTEFRIRPEILASFPNGLTDYAESISLITKGIVPGMVTDDVGSSCFLMRTILKHHGKFDRDIAAEAILAWSEDENTFGKYAGQNTKASLEKLREGIVVDEKAKAMHFGRQNTNGGAMKAAPVGLLARGNRTKALAYSIDLCYPTHYNSAAVSGAAAIACAVCEAASETATLSSIYEAAMWGAREGKKQLDSEGLYSYGPSVEHKIRQAVALAEGCASRAELIDLLNDEIGTTSQVQHSIPAVFAIIAGTKGDFQEAVLTAVNAGGDTDTIASMTGAILGAYRGAVAVPVEAVERINKENEFLQLKETFSDFTEFLKEEP